MIVSTFLKFILNMVALNMIRNSIGFNEILTNVVFVVFFSIACAFLPMKILLVALAAYCTVQVFSLSAGLGVLAGMLFGLMYLIFFRFDAKRGYVILLIPLLCMIKVPIMIPLILAVSTPLGSVFSVIFGFVSYYFLHYIHIYAPVYQGLMDNGTSEIKKMSICLQDMIAYKEMIFTIICVVIMFLVVFYAKKIRVNRSNEMAISTGAGVYLILIIISSMLFGNMTYSKLIWFVVGAVISCIVAMIVSGVIVPLDYNRTEILEFEDEEYKYYVRAVPKAAVARRSVKIKRIYSRRQHHDHKKEKEETL